MPSPNASPAAEPLFFQRSCSPSPKVEALSGSLSAFGGAGWVVVLTVSDVDARIAEIDENLTRLELTVLERQEQLMERKQLYEEKHPKTKHGGDRRPSPQLEDLKPERFTKDVSKRIGRSEQAVQRDIQIAKGIVPEVRDQLRETRFANNQSELLSLSRLPEEQQRQVATMDTPYSTPSA